MNSQRIRQQFLSFFEQSGHRVIASASLIPADDPTLLFTNAGMVPFKNQFIGREKADYDRATSVQRCIRAGGKHNDLENVGYTSRHHTLFEMLGNFSFGAYFKQEAIGYAWEFLTGVLKIPAEKFWITVHQDDQEAAVIWAKLVPKARILRLGDEDNFWMMGQTGPCGPCSEIYYDHGPEVAGGLPGTPEAEGDRYVEIWNLVFMQYEIGENGHRHDLPAPCVDTGMGLERVTAVMQGVQNNYETDIFLPLLQAIQQAAGDPPSVENAASKASSRVIADHIRSSSLLIAEGIMPGNEGRNYVLRRIIRRALRHTRQLGIEAGFFADLSRPLAEMMQAAWPHLAKAQAQVQQVLRKETKLFERTLHQGMGLLEKAMHSLQADKQQQLSGDLIFKLYDTYGFPPDLTADVGREHGFSMDMQGFDQAMAQQKARAKAAHRFSEQETAKVGVGLSTDFIGYEQVVAEHIAVAGLYAITEGADAKRTQSIIPSEKLEAQQRGIVALKCTPFYAQSGGQVGDIGWLDWQDGQFQITDTTKNGDCHLHHGLVTKGTLTAQTQITAKVNAARRQQIRRNHSATHLLHAALRKVLGAGVEQKGSLVDANKLRFDFSHGAPITQDERLQIEQMVNTEILGNSAVATETMDKAAASQKGAVALFGEKYADQVRVLTMGTDNFSIELCGGTHVVRTGDIGSFCIVDESSISAGVRRIEAVTGEAAAQLISSWRQQLNALQKILKTDAASLTEKVEQLQAQQKSLQKELQKLGDVAAMQAVGDLAAQAKSIGDAKVLVTELKDVTESKKAMKLLDELKTVLGKAVVMLAIVDQGKVSLVASVSKSLTNKIKAVELTKIAGDLVGARGGGRPDMARAGGGQQVKQLPAALEKASALIAEKLS